ncbi:MAG: hypothetical protein ACOX3U_06695 [Christensenellales bacterium]|jgi:DNA polymerase-3 subunit delta'
MKYLSLIKRTPALKTMQKDVLSGNISHCYLIISPDSGLIKTFFYASACLIMCGDGCCECALCIKVKNNNHADIRHILPENGKGIDVERTKEIIESMLLSPIEAQKKIYYFYNGEKLSQTVQNKLLKTLEEPPQGVIIFIGTASEDAIITTVKSRARKLYIDNLDPEDIYLELSKVYGESDKVYNAALMSGGNMERAERLILDEEYIENLSEARNALTNLKKSADIIKYLNNPAFSKERLPDTLDLMEILLRDALEYSINNNNKSGDSGIIIERYNTRALAIILDLVIKAKQKISSYCNNTNIIDNLLMNMLEVGYRCRKS